MLGYGPLVDNPDRSRFELEIEGQIAFAIYELAPGRIIINHVETPLALRRRGVASALAQAVLAEAGQRGLAVTPRCAFMAAYIRRHPGEVARVGDSATQPPTSD